MSTDISKISNEEIEDFLEKVENVTNKVNGLLKGTISIEEIEKEEKELERKKKIIEIKEKEKKEKEKELILNGREGKGEKKNYLYFCKFCFVEYTYELKNCVRCKHKVITQEERSKELKEKVEEYKKKIQLRDLRKKNFEKIKENNNKKTNLINYQKWNLYEPSSDSLDDYKKEIVLPKKDKNFQMLEEKINKNIKIREENKKVAYKLKEKGNKYYEKGDYLNAIECYKDSINICKDYLQVYTNLSLCQIKVFQYENAIESCDKVIEYYDVFKDIKINKNIMFKAYCRKAIALFHLKEIEKSLENFKKAKLYYSNDKKVDEYINKCENIFKELKTKKIEIKENIKDET